MIPLLAIALGAQQENLLEPFEPDRVTRVVLTERLSRVSEMELRTIQPEGGYLVKSGEKLDDGRVLALLSLTLADEHAFLGTVEVDPKKVHLDPADLSIKFVLEREEKTFLFGAGTGGDADESLMKVAGELRRILRP